MMRFLRWMRPTVRRLTLKPGDALLVTVPKCNRENMEWIRAGLQSKFEGTTVFVVQQGVDVTVVSRRTRPIGTAGGHQPTSTHAKPTGPVPVARETRPPARLGGNIEAGMR